MERSDPPGRQLAFRRSRIGALRFRRSPDSPFLAATGGRIPPLVQLAALLNAAAAVQGETETA